MAEKVIQLYDERVYASFHIISKRKVHYSSWHGFFYVDPFIKECFHFFQVMEGNAVKLHSTLRLESISMDHGEFQLKDETCRYLLNPFSKRIF